MEGEAYEKCGGGDSHANCKNRCHICYEVTLRKAFESLEDVDFEKIWRMLADWRWLIENGYMGLKVFSLLDD
jgi:plasmid rolling circle replication initiator protein Rep